MLNRIYLLFLLIQAGTLLQTLPGYSQTLPVEGDAAFYLRIGARQNTFEIGQLIRISIASSHSGSVRILSQNVNTQSSRHILDVNIKANHKSFVELPGFDQEGRYRFIAEFNSETPVRDENRNDEIMIQVVEPLTATRIKKRIDSIQRAQPWRAKLEELRQLQEALNLWKESRYPDSQEEEEAMEAELGRSSGASGEEQFQLLVLYHYLETILNALLPLEKYPDITLCEMLEHDIRFSGTDREDQERLTRDATTALSLLNAACQN